MINSRPVKFKDRLFSRWVVCKVISDKQSVQYGLYFSYPLYILIVITGIVSVNPYILSLSALIAFLGIKLPMHPFDYLYNLVFPRLIRTNKIPGRGSELQVNSIIAVLFNLLVIGLIIFGISINFGALAIIYTLFSVYFIVKFLFKD